MSNEKDWIDVIGALGPSIIAAMVAYIAWMQWRTSDKARRTALIDRYESNYGKLSDALGCITREGRVTPDARANLWQARDEARLFLAQEVADYVEGLLTEAGQASAVENRLKNVPVGEKRNALVEEMHGHLDVLWDARPHTLYRKYLAHD